MAHNKMMTDQLGSHGIERRMIAQALRQIRIGDKALGKGDSDSFANIEQLLRAFLGQLFVSDSFASKFLQDHVSKEAIAGQAVAAPNQGDAALAQFARDVAKSHLRVRVPHIV